jgi:hypothetical protein
MDKYEILDIALGKYTTLPDNFEDTVPVSLAASFDKELWSNCYVTIMHDMLDRIEIDSFIDGVLTYRNRYYEVLEIEVDEEGNEIEPRDLIDDLVYVYDLKPIIEKRLSYENTREWFDAYFFEVQRFNRSTPLFKYLLKDYDMALNHLRLGWRNREATFRTSDGPWNYFTSEYNDKLIIKKIYARADAIVYIKLEGALEFMITKEELDAWGVTEEQLFEDIFKRAYDVFKEDITVTPTFYEDFDLQTYRLYHKHRHMPTLVAGLHHWLPESDGELGSIFVMPNDSACYLFKFDSMQDLIFSIEFMLPHIKKHYSMVYSIHELFENSFYWTKNGCIEKFEVKKENEDVFGEVQLVFPDTMTDTINNAARE